VLRVGSAALIAPQFGARETSAAAPGGLVGSVRLEGTPPKRAPISMAKEPSCAAMHHGPVLAEDVCHGRRRQPARTWWSTYPRGCRRPVRRPPQEPVIINQEGCSYNAACDCDAGQSENPDCEQRTRTSHNIHPMPESNREWNQVAAAGCGSVRRRRSPAKRSASP